MKYDCFDYGMSEDAPLTHRKYKCKICRKYINPTFQVNALHHGYWFCDHIKFCYDHNEQEMREWLRGHIKYELTKHWRESYRDTIEVIIVIYLKQQKYLSFLLLNPNVVMGLNPTFEIRCPK